MAAPVVKYTRTELPFGERGSLPCLYVQVDAISSPDVADFLSGWRGCCERAELEWQTVRRPASALIALELSHACGVPTSLRIVFDARRDRAALDALADTEAIVVGSRRYGHFANRMAAYSIEGHAIRTAITKAEHGLRSLVAS
ncbi:MAG TPA: hypothetical protein VHN98_05880 [Acidimicrobiales bacterium]|nr:hypothetical protein [Acidimicrobiales bacterium]